VNSSALLFEADKDGRRWTVKLDSANTGRRGASGVVFQHPSETGKAIKIYHPDERAKFENKVRAMVKVRYKRPHVQHFDFAWPETVISDSAGTFLGFKMPYFGSGWVDLESLMQASEAETKYKFGEKERLIIAANLTLAINELHRNKTYAIDLKPDNIRIQLQNMAVGIIDCDGMSVRDIYSSDGKRFFADKSTPEFWSPENMGRKPDEFKDEESHDRFALSAIIFMLLNRGIHPYQGVMSFELAGAETTAGKIKNNLYPYNGDRRRISPHKDSLYDYWPSELRNLFDRAFTTTMARPSAKEWLSYLEQLLTTLAPCESQPKLHIKYPLVGCPVCVREHTFIQRQGPTALPLPNFPFGPGRTPGERPAASTPSSTTYQGSVPNTPSPAYFYGSPASPSFHGGYSIPLSSTPSSTWALPTSSPSWRSWLPAGEDVARLIGLVAGVGLLGLVLWNGVPYLVGAAESGWSSVGNATSSIVHSAGNWFASLGSGVGSGPSGSVPQPRCEQRTVFDTAVRGGAAALRSYVTECRYGPFATQANSALENVAYNDGLTCIRASCASDSCVSAFSSEFRNSPRLASLREEALQKKNSSTCRPAPPPPVNRCLQATVFDQAAQNGKSGLRAYISECEYQGSPYLSRAKALVEEMSYADTLACIRSTCPVTNCNGMYTGGGGEVPNRRASLIAEMERAAASCNTGGPTITLGPGAPANGVYYGPGAQSSPVARPSIGGGGFTYGR
jgi:serine/threonine protein kinase